MIEKRSEEREEKGVYGHVVVSSASFDDFSYYIKFLNEEEFDEYLGLMFLKCARTIELIRKFIWPEMVTYLSFSFSFTVVSTLFFAFYFKYYVKTSYFVHL